MWLTSRGADVIRSGSFGVGIREGRSGSVAAIVEADRGGRIRRRWRIGGRGCGGGHCRRQRGAVVGIGRFRLTLDDPLAASVVVVVEDQSASRHRRLHGNRIEQRIVAAQIKRQTIDLATAAATAATGWMVTAFLLMMRWMRRLLRWSQSGSGESSRMKRLECMLFTGGQRTEGARTKRQSRIKTRMEKWILQMKKRPSQTVMMGSRGGCCGGGCGFRRTQSSQGWSRKRIIQILTVRIL